MKLKLFEEFNPTNEGLQYEAAEEISGYDNALVLIMDVGERKHTISQRMQWLKHVAAESNCEIGGVIENMVVVLPKDENIKNLDTFKKNMGL